MAIESRSNSNTISLAGRPSGTRQLDDALDQMARDPARLATASIVLGVAALTLVVLAGAWLLRPPSPQAVGALPPLAASPANPPAQVPAGPAGLAKLEFVPAKPGEPAPPETRVRGLRLPFTIASGHRYSATVTLSLVEAVADNGRIASVLTGAGFVHVTVTGSGNTRTATGTWAGATTTQTLDAHLSNVKDVSG